MRRIKLEFLPFTILLAACGAAGTTAAPTTTPPPAAHTLTVYAAASLSNAFGEIGKNFEAANPGVTVGFNFAGSQTLSAQLLQGAPADVFASANHTEMDKVVAGSLVAQGAAKDFLTNQLVVILPPANPAGLQSLQDLSKAGVKLVLADATVPAGKYARQILDALSKDPAYGPDFSTRVLANVVSNETDVEVVVTKVHLGEADAGIVYVSDTVATPDLKTLAIPATFNVIAKYPIAALTKSTQPDLAAAFVNYVLSADGQAVLKKWGFGPVAP